MPSSILNSDDGVISGTSGLKSSGGDDGVLVFQSKGTETARINTDKQIVAAAGTASLPVLTTTGDLNTGIYFPAADNIGFATGGTIRGRWTTDGLCFGSDTAAANALDDYEEGTFTPGIAYETPGTSSITFSAQFGTYTKVGRVVYFTTDVRIQTFSKGTASGSLRITGLPFAQRNTAGQDSARCTIQLYEWTYTTSPIIAAVVTTSTVISIARMVSNGVTADIDDPRAGSFVWVTGFYFV